MRIAERLEQRTTGRAKHKMLRKQTKAKQGRWRREVTENLCEQIEWAIGNNDTGTFYRVMREFGVYMYENKTAELEKFTPG